MVLVFICTLEAEFYRIFYSYLSFHKSHLKLICTECLKLCGHRKNKLYTLPLNTKNNKIISKIRHHTTLFVFNFFSATRTDWNKKMLFTPQNVSSKIRINLFKNVRHKLQNIFYSIWATLEFAFVGTIKDGSGSVGGEGRCILLPECL